MSCADYLKSRGWKLTRYGWEKMGWELPPERALCLERHVAATGGTFPLPISATPEHLNATYPSASQIEAARKAIRRGGLRA
jgi:hypothetical protein